MKYQQGKVMENVSNMVSKDFEIVNRLGLHARAASKLVNLTSNFDCEIFISKEGQEVNAKSIMGILILAAAKGTTVTVRAEGSDADDALSSVGDLIKEGFGEE